MTMINKISIPLIANGFKRANGASRVACLDTTIFLLFFMILGSGGARAADLTIYSNSLPSGWADWSWNTTVNFSSTSPVYAGASAMSVTFNSAWAGLYLHSANNITASQYTALRFWVNGRTGGQKVRVALYDASLNMAGNGVTLTLTANQWQKVEIPITSLGSPTQISGVVWQESAGAAAPAFSLDEVVLVGASGTPTPTPTPTPTLTPTPTPIPVAGPTLTVNAAAGRHPISPLIYGMNFADESLAKELKLPVRRWGGNSTTRYNWQNDTANHAMDWYFENIPEDNPNPSQLPNGSTTDRFVDQDRRTGTKTILTMPLIGWTPKNREYLGGFSVAKYGAQQDVDPWRPDFGNGVRPDGTNITGNDPRDTSLPIAPSFVQDWIRHLISRYGTAAQGGVAFYNLDNEPMLWNSTHRDVHPQPTSYDEILSRTLAYAPAIKSADPTAATLGPVLWGWTAYFYSALDAAPGGAWWNNPQDRNAHGGVPFVDWYLRQVRAWDQAHGGRSLDYLDLHYYPQASGVSLSGAGSASTQALRLRSTRSLWDPNYTDESWIGEPVRLIPRMRDWVNNNYPGTKLAVTEYNWGALDNINGALAQADVLGIFGREGLDLATLWAPPTSTQPGAYAFRIYRNYDGQGSAFGDEGVQAASSDQASLAVYAARRTGDRALTLVVINKTGNDLKATVTLSGYLPTNKAAVYRYSAANLGAIVRQADQNVTSTGFQATFPKNSITLVVLKTVSGVAGNWTLYGGDS